ncbi:MAG: type II CAAX endopeptidase family protein, partial [Dehalococcoidia bacterium]
MNLTQQPMVESPGEPPASGAVPWDAADVVKAVGVSLGLLIGGILVLIIVNAGFDANSTALALAFTGASELVLVWAAWRFSVFKHGCSWRALGFRRLRLGDARWAVPAGVLASLAIAVLYAAVINGLGWGDNVRSDSFLDESRAVQVAASLLAVVVAPLAEETFFRGFVFTGLRRRLGLRGAAVAASGLFALAHIQPISYVPIFMIGLVL